MDKETIQTLLDLLNPLHGSLDEQTYDDKLAENFDGPPDREFDVRITAQQERDLTQAVLILENRRAALNRIEAQRVEMWPGNATTLNRTEGE